MTLLIHDFGKAFTPPRVDFSLEASPVGTVLMASAEGMICFIGFADSCGAAMQILESEFPGAIVTLANIPVHSAIIRDFFDNEECRDAHVAIWGSEFSKNVWQTLLAIPRGDTVSYSHLAAMAGRPAAVRAVASAVGRNRISLLLPCHRVVAASGATGGYRWGTPVKRALLTLEKDLCK